MDIGGIFSKDILESQDDFLALNDRHALIQGPAVGATTKLRGEFGEIEAGDLKVGDRLFTRDHGLRPIRQIIEFHPKRGLDEVITIRPDALDNCAKLVITPDHGVLFSSWRVECLFDTFEVLAPAKGLINGKSIIKSREAPKKMIQILMDKHEIIFAEDLPIETLHPYANETNTSDWPMGITPESFGSHARKRVNAIDARDLSPED